MEGELIAALKGLRAIIHDDLTHARQREHAEAIAEADRLIARGDRHAPRPLVRLGQGEYVREWNMPIPKPSTDGTL